MLACTLMYLNFVFVDQNEIITNALSKAVEASIMLGHFHDLCSSTNTLLDRSPHPELTPEYM